MVASFTPCKVWRPWDKEYRSPSSISILVPGSKELIFTICTILLHCFQESPASGHNEFPPIGIISHPQKSWDLPRISSVAAELLTTTSDALFNARLPPRRRNLVPGCIPYQLHPWPLHRQYHHSHSHWPSSGGPTHFVSLTLSLLWIKHGHPWHAWAQFSCFSAGHHFRHATLNDILHNELSSANINTRLEPTGLDPVDGKHPLWFLGDMADFRLGMQPV